MADLIDRAALYEKIQPVDFLYGHDEDAPYSGMAVDACDIEDAPTVDAVEVVRCEKCIGRTTWIKSVDNAVNICGMSGMFPRGETDYCSYSERRPDADN